MAKKFDILHSHFVEGKGVKEIARETEVSRNTVRGYLREFAEQKEELLAGGDRSALLLAMSEPAKYNSRGRERTVVTDEVIEIIQQCLLDNMHKRELGNSKLCMKSKDIYEFLLEKGFKISYPSVNNTVRELRDQKKEAYIKQEYAYGEVCEFDWGEVKLTIAEKLVSFKLAVFTLAASNIRYGILYRHEDTQAFVDAHIRFFHFIGAVPETMVYDNMRVAIAKFVGKQEKIATIALKQLSTYYGFTYRFCNICHGNEKGHVERSVEVMRRRAFSSVSEFENQKAAEQRLEVTITRLNSDKEEHRVKEVAGMLPGMPDYSSVIRQSGIVDKFSTISYKQNHYSVPDYLVGKQVEVLAFVNEIVLKYQTHEVARHRRSYENHTYTLDILHYRDTLLRKPGALKNSVCLSQACVILQVIFDRYFQQRPKEFILLLKLLEHHSLYQIKTAIESLEQTGAQIYLGTIQMLLENKQHPSYAVLQSDGQDPIEAACEAQLERWVVA